MRMSMEPIEKVNRIDILSVFMLGAALFALPVHAQNRGMGGVAPGPRLVLKPCFRGRPSSCARGCPDDWEELSLSISG